uniref:hypothetical protein n=1 Tax=Burkholderia diffusa TaxID=488732 RepID=UPI001CC80AEC|nr:hypothetical protein [Burkholderia diffusa]
MTDFEIIVLKLKLLEAWIEADELLETQSRKSGCTGKSLASIKSKLDEALATLDRHAPKLASARPVGVANVIATPTPPPGICCR